ncbi:hypothetical protein MKW94_007550 [Papaver nudicaule]|uniref:Inosine/uridine-preferring nucleoside hydrolase domain-containing protein n=1 Tax=Papaver nudicaule TaxID=74823 RepID=A0AA41VQ85_PAPNU|nr:hypothetical protein [Papaver nudicaule]
MRGTERVAVSCSIWLLLLTVTVQISLTECGAKPPRRILVDTDVVADDVFALLYLLKFNRSLIDLKGTSTFGGCRYRQAVPRGRLYTDTNYGIRRSFLPQGCRRYSPLRQPTAQQVMIDTISKGPTTVFLIGTHTNFAIFLMSNPQLKKNIEHIYVMGGGVRSKSPIGCCPKDANTSCTPTECGVRGNLFTDYSSNPYAEFNIFGDPFAAYQVVHSGIPVTLVPLDATNTIPTDEKFFEAFEQNQHTYEAQYVLQTLKIIRGIWRDNQFYAILNLPQHTGRFNFTTEFPYYKEVVYNPDLAKKKLGKPVIFDMDMSAGDFISLIYLLKVPVEVLNLKAILVSGTGWANVATIDIIYDILHMMGRDDIPVGRGDVFALGQSNPSFPAAGDCKYAKAIPQGSGGVMDSDTLYGLSRDLPRSPRRYTAENSVKHGAPRDTDHPELRQPLALEVWQSITKSVDPGSKITVLTNGPLTNLAHIVLSEKNLSSVILNVYVVGGHISYGTKDKGNVFSVPSNAYAEFNMFLDPTAAKTVLTSELNITIIPLEVQRQVCSFPDSLRRLKLSENTPEAVFTRRLLSRLHRLQRKHVRYQHMGTFLGEILGAVFLAGDQHLNPTCAVKPVKVLATGDLSKDGQTIIDEKHGKPVNIVERVNSQKYYAAFANLLGQKLQSAVIGSFEEQKKMWSTPTYRSLVSGS